MHSTFEDYTYTFFVNNAQIVWIIHAIYLLIYYIAGTYKH